MAPRTRRAAETNARSMGRAIEDKPSGWCWRVRARIRPAKPFELPPGVSDTRMVQFSTTTESGMQIIDYVAFYDPMPDLDLIGVFIHIFADHQPSDTQVIDFYDRYGPLSHHETVDGESLPAWVWRLQPEDREKLSTEARFGQCEPLWWVRERAMELRLSYDLWAALRQYNVPALRALLGGVPEGKVLTGIAIVAGRVVHTVVDEKDVGRGQAGSFSLESHAANAAAGSIRPLTDDECRLWGRRALAAQLNVGESRTKREWAARDDLFIQASSREPPKGTPDLVRVTGFHGLDTALHLQLAELVDRDLILRQCIGCQRLFYPRRTDQRYCTAACGDATRQRGYYRQQKRRTAATERPERSARGRRPA